MIISNFWHHHLAISITIISVLGLVVIHTTICVLHAGEWFPKDKVLYKYLLSFSEKIILNEGNSRPYFSINHGNGNIGVFDLPLLCKWTVDKIGPVPRWYKSHRYIEKLYKAQSTKEKGWQRRTTYFKVFGGNLPE